MMFVYYFDFLEKRELKYSLFPSCVFSLSLHASSRPLADHGRRSLPTLHASAGHVQRVAKPLAASWTTAKVRRWPHDCMGKIGRNFSAFKHYSPTNFDNQTGCHPAHLSFLFKTVPSISNENVWIVGMHFHAIENFVSRSEPNKTLF